MAYIVMESHGKVMEFYYQISVGTLKLPQFSQLYNEYWHIDSGENM